MLLHAKTYENIKTSNQNFPIEDSFYATNNLVVVADGITRDPIGVLNFKKATFQEFLDCYPRPSGGELAAKEICDTFRKNEYDLSLLELMKKANENVKFLNKKYIEKCDYLENDYYGAVCSSVLIHDNILDYAYICDCGVIIYDRNGKIRFQTEDDKLKVDPYINQIGVPWNLPLARSIVRKEYRNQPNHYIDGNLASYGAFTGEKEALEFIKTGSISLEEGDMVIVYSDGFVEFFKRNDFYENVICAIKDSKQFDDYVEKISLLDYEKYGKEKTIVMLGV